MYVCICWGLNVFAAAGNILIGQVHELSLCCFKNALSVEVFYLYKVIESFELEGAFKVHAVQVSCNEQKSTDHGLILLMSHSVLDTLSSLLQLGN